ncbi:MAG: nucleotidyltransferase family protein [Acidobacteriaceae bacterium]
MSNETPVDTLRIPAVLLAAGASTRLGRPKQLLRLAAFGDETLLDRAVRLAREVGVAPVFVVLGAHSDAILQQAQFADANILFNPAWQEGMASSLRVGVRAVMEQLPLASAALVMVCDQPALSAEHLRRLLAAHDAAPEMAVASHYAGRPGVPVILPRALFPALLTLTGDQGARAILRQATAIALVEFPGGEWDIDRPQDLPRS